MRMTSCPEDHEITYCDHLHLGRPSKVTDPLRGCAVAIFTEKEDDDYCWS